MSETYFIWQRIIETLRERGPMTASVLWTAVSGSDRIMDHYHVAVQLQPMIREGFLETDCESPFKDNDRVVTASETISLVAQQ